MLSAILLILVLCYMIYGVVQVIRDKSLTMLARLIWIAIIVIIPVLGAGWYLRSNFQTRHGRW